MNSSLNKFKTETLYFESECRLYIALGETTQPRAFESMIDLDLYAIKTKINMIILVYSGWLIHPNLVL
jgi:hypothetical protein